MVDSGHSIIQVGQVGSAGIEGSAGMVIVRIGMSNRHSAKLTGLLHKFCSTGKLRRDVHNADQTTAVFKQLLKAFEIRLFQIVGILSAALFVGEVRTLHLNAAQGAAALRSFLHQLLRSGKGFSQHIVRQGHGSGCKGSDATLGIVSSHTLQTLIVTVREVSTGVAVTVNIDQTGDDGCALQVNGICRHFLRQNRTKTAILYLESTNMKLKIRTKNSGIFIKHNVNSFLKKGQRPLGAAPVIYLRISGRDAAATD